MRRAIRAVSVLSVALLTCATANAVTLQNIRGDVLVNGGGGFEPLFSGGTVGPGDKIFARNGSVDIVYDDACKVTVHPGSTATVLAASPCQPAGGGGGAGDPPVGGFGEPTDYLIAATIAAGVAIPVIALATTHGGHPTNPSGPVDP
jgi:hypothetical protein